ncbi:hypothetical protein EBB79_03090 [Parasedimentitalea marina]|uniref:Tripartite tricarboxylate transporter TctB family protein n=1 Tax=Parasedimentitalea marina TaxID=2483033 RepID=A0A3T0MYZ2_9RHOB|nr:hypothetical protein [Parasedimentitalea marina]AZV76980.1 hypothetical protein EBB79_03090 [Parasedimentitalea marina]
MNNRDQAVLFALITLMGLGVVATAIATPPSRFDPVGTQNIMGVIGALATFLAALCTASAVRRARQAGAEETGKSLDTLKTGLIFVAVPAAMSVLIVKRLFSTELVLIAIFALIGLLVIKVSPDHKPTGKTLGYLCISGVVLTLGVAQLFKNVLGLPLP